MTESLNVPAGIDFAFNEDTSMLSITRLDGGTITFNAAPDFFTKLRNFFGEQTYCLLDARGVWWWHEDWSWRSERSTHFSARSGPQNAWLNIVGYYGIDSGEPQWHVGDLVAGENVEYRRSDLHSWYRVWPASDHWHPSDDQIERWIATNQLRVVRKGGALQ